MKVYISADLEGIGGVVCKEQVTRGTEEYKTACKFLSMEVYDLIDGLVKAGADEVFVYDAHGSGINIMYDYMHPKARYIQGYPHPGVRFPFLDESFDFMILQGYHAMAGTEGAVLDHSYSSASIENIYVNDKRCGEIYIDALVASELKVPVALVTGDDKALKEALDIMPWIKTIETKKAIARNCALITSPIKIKENINQICSELIKDVSQYKLLVIPESYEVKTEYTLSSYVDSMYFNNDKVMKLDSRTVLKKGEKIWQTIEK